MKLKITRIQLDAIKHAEYRASLL